MKTLYCHEKKNSNELERHFVTDYRNFPINKELRYYNPST